MNVCLRRESPPFPFYYGYMRESQYSLWVSTQHANNWNFNPASAPEVSFARECARTTLEYYDRGLEIAESANVARLYEHVVTFVMPGGIDNLRNFAFEGLSAFEFVSNIGRDLAVDVATCKAGRFVSRMSKTSLRAAKQDRILSRGGRGNRAQQRVVDTAEARNRCWDQMKSSGEWRHVTGRNKPTLEHTRSGRFAQKSIEKWEIEVFDRNENHIGVIKPSDGKFHPELAVRGRKMER